MRAHVITDKWVLVLLAIFVCGCRSAEHTDNKDSLPPTENARPSIKVTELSTENLSYDYGVHVNFEGISYYMPFEATTKPFVYVGNLRFVAYDYRFPKSYRVVLCKTCYEDYTLDAIKWQLKYVNEMPWFHQITGIDIIDIYKIHNLFGYVAHDIWVSRWGVAVHRYMIEYIKDDRFISVSISGPRPLNINRIGAIINNTRLLQPDDADFSP